MQNTGFLRRIGAMMYDGLLILALLFITTLPFIALREGEPVESNENWLYRVALTVVIYGFFTGFMDIWFGTRLTPARDRTSPGARPRRAPSSPWC